VVTQGGEHEFLQTDAIVLIEIDEDLPAHPGLPESPQMICDIPGALRLIGIAFKERSNIVSHFDKPLGIHLALA